ncbi:MAG: hypothetical protein OEZ10_02540 [Gammaproteobacteria bacterium]|nr:hypothetical protein [Gammaproteobacteria bacterium]
MKILDFIRATLFLAPTLLIPVTGVATENRPTLPAEIVNFGIVDELRARNMEIIINDTLLKLSAGSRIKNAQGTPIPVSFARKGTKAAYSVKHDNRSGYGIIIELWLLPADYNLPQ